MKTKTEVYFRITHTRKASNIGHELQLLSLIVFGTKMPNRLQEWFLITDSNNKRKTHRSMGATMRLVLVLCV